VEREIALVKRITTIGSDPENDVVVADPALPRTALHIHFDGRDYSAAAHDGADMAVNGKRRALWRLGPGDRIQVAGTELRFDPTSRTPAPATRPGAGQRLLALESLVRFSERLLGANDLARLLDELLDALLEVTHADKGFLILLEDGEMSVRAARNVARETIEGAVASVSDSIIQRVVETRRPIVVADALHDSEWSGSTSVVNLKLCSVMCAPLMQKGDVFGVIYLGNDSVVSLFDQRSLEALTVFTAQASLLVQNAMLVDHLRRENVALREAVASKQYGELIGAGASMREVYRRIEKVAGTDISVLVTGETGTGKEVVAREIHRRRAASS
jgi:transcriptional regulator with GAF, ATPase, and Fis domain